MSPHPPKPTHIPKEGHSISGWIQWLTRHQQPSTDVRSSEGSLQISGWLHWLTRHQQPSTDVKINRRVPADFRAVSMANAPSTILYRCEDQQKGPCRFQGGFNGLCAINNPLQM
ncbi:hypothetical protein PoB_003503200 [Plakobranchus ocellatus]|uniref:Uncharacterized protein n=1 Tax=Plakobranchus ocellatus TaxID=259542 RepID=A0AAV4AMP1_9GAST|nr:hypothetical protein PoB_003503200 [Plakobranchus ocellatus]